MCSTQLLNHTGKVLILNRLQVQLAENPRSARVAVRRRGSASFGRLLISPLTGGEQQQQRLRPLSGPRP